MTLKTELGFSKKVTGNHNIWSFCHAEGNRSQSTEHLCLTQKIHHRFHLLRRLKIDFEKKIKAEEQEIRDAHGRGVLLFQNKDWLSSTQELVKALKPLLSKSSIRNFRVNIENVKVEVLDSMYHLGLIYQTDGLYPNSYPKVAAIFQYCVGFAKRYKIDNDAFLKQAYEVEIKFLNNLGKSANHCDIRERMTQYKSELEEIRNIAQRQLDQIRKFTIEKAHKFAQKVEENYDYCARRFINFGNDEGAGLGLIQKMLMECISQLGEVPCEYSVIALGSFASGKMTPWSDLEFGILISDHEEEYKEYFRNFTKLFYIKVINLGETPLRRVGVELLNDFKTAQKESDWFWDEISNNGFSFDGLEWHACKSPLGRQGHYKVVQSDNKGTTKILEDKLDYELILTPQQMAEFQIEKYGWHDSDKYLVQALRSVSLIMGSQALLDHYRREARNAENIETVRIRTLEILQEDMNKLSFEPDGDDKGLFNVKNDLYRLSERTIDGLANYYGIEASEGQPMLTAWKAINTIERLGILSAEGAEHLREALSIATALRLVTYYNNEGQNEDLITHKSDHENSVKAFYLENTTILSHFYYIMFGVQELMKVFCQQKPQDLNEFENSLKCNRLFCDDNYYRGMLHIRLLEYDQAISCLETFIMEQYRNRFTNEQPRDLIISKSLSSLYKKLGNYNQALRFGYQALELGKELLGLEHPNVARTLDDIGDLHTELGDYLQGLQYGLQARELYQKSGVEDQKVVLNLNRLGSTYNEIYDYKQALEYHLQALEFNTKLLSSQPQDVALYLNDIACTYNKLGDYQRALIYQLEALGVCKRLYESTHPIAVRLQQNLAKIQSYSQIEDKVLQALSIRQQSSDDSEEVEIIISTEGLQEGDIKEYYQTRFRNNILNLESCDGRCSVILNENCRIILSELLSLTNIGTTEAIDNPQISNDLSPTLLGLQQKSTIRLITYNITADYLDGKDRTEDSHHQWQRRKPDVIKLLELVKPDIICLQELSTNQASELNTYFADRHSHQSLFLSQTPSEVDAGNIVVGKEVEAWCGKRMWAPLIGMLVSTNCELLEMGQFWLEGQPDQLPISTDRDETDKGFGNMNTYRAVLWTKIRMDEEKILFVFNSHHSLSGDNQIRLACAELERQKIQEITQGAPWILAGDRNVISDSDSNLSTTVRQELAQEAFDTFDSPNREDLETTWIGFTYDKYQDRIVNGKFQVNNKPGVITSSLETSYAFSLRGAFDPVEQTLLPLLGDLNSQQNEDHYFTSDHALVWAGFIWL